MLRAHIWVSGMVQGVFYRKTTKEEAVKLNLTGWVKNLPDGRVEILAEGGDENVNKLLTWCEQGPPYARVDDVRVEWEEPTGEFERFSVTY